MIYIIIIYFLSGVLSLKILDKTLSTKQEELNNLSYYEYFNKYIIILLVIAVLLGPLYTLYHLYLYLRILMSISALRTEPIEEIKCLSKEEQKEIFEEFWKEVNEMRALDFLKYIRDEVYSLPSSVSGKGQPSNKELRDRWLIDKIVLCNGEILTRESIVKFPVEQLVFFPNNPNRRCTQR